MHMRCAWSKHTFGVSQVADDEISDNSAECVVCLSDVRDTLILPCRHLCLCNACADTLRYQANCCPICRLRESQQLVCAKACQSHLTHWFIVVKWLFLHCPCVSPAFRALLQIRAMRKRLSLSPAGMNPVITSQTSDSEEVRPHTQHIYIHSYLLFCAVQHIASQRTLQFSKSTV